MTVTGARARGRSTSIYTKTQAFRELLSQGSLRVIIPITLPLLVYRLTVNSWGRGDLIVVAITIAITGPVEWLIHRYGLHAPQDSFRTKKLDLSTGHRYHHLDPLDLQWVLLPAVRAALFMPMIALFTAAWSLPLLLLLGTAMATPFVSAVIAAWLSLAHYEWVHLLVHTRYRMKSPYYARLSRNHRLHHYRNEKYWLGVTANSGDRLFRTLPASNTKVELSHTARTLSAEGLTLDR